MPYFYDIAYTSGTYAVPENLKLESVQELVTPQISINHHHLIATTIIKIIMKVM